MAQAQLRRLADGLGSRSSAPLERSRERGVELPPRGTALADEVRVVGVREPVRLGPELGHERLLLEAEHRLRRAGGGEERLDRLAPLGVGGGVTGPVDDA